MPEKTVDSPFHVLSSIRVTPTVTASENSNVFVFILNRKVFRDAVAEAGTLPALGAITNWMRSNKVAEEEAAEIVATLPRSALTPSPDYIKTLFVSIRNKFNTVCLFTSN
jgi:hypothetical protein